MCILNCSISCRYSCSRHNSYFGPCFLGSSVVKNLPANARDMGSILGSGRSPGEGNGNPLQYSCLGNPMKQRSLAGYCPWSRERVRYNLATQQQFTWPVYICTAVLGYILRWLFLGIFLWFFIEMEILKKLSMIQL